ncbi:ABC transporter permease [Treponema pedis]|uniref:Oligopeptide ABC transporter permease n=2 Tax=Treponema pedis TaxID=409322 RepID=S5ZW66_9SPIR|nr:ABC transporter permease [Treponema pedis]AGT44565.1 oligopeptide ABC transporter permease [Treponema pedis str. T A4]QOW59898.1 ABC transporter permease [Treponema pedis]QSI05241.1 ABC transporter permease [Treponema pedis]
MGRYIAKRIIYMFITLFIIATATFYLMHSVPGDPLTARIQKALPPQVRANFEKKYGLDKSVMEQYFIFLKNVFTKGDLGESITYPGLKVSDTILKNAPVSGSIGSRALIIGIVLGVIAGMIAALKRGKWPDYLVIFIAILGVTMPSFVLASLLQYFFAVILGILPAIGWGSAEKYKIIPVLALSFGTIATYARYVRSSVLEVLSADYILTAEAKGVSHFNILRKHVFRNAMTPSLTLLAGRIAGIFTGSFVIEKVFSIPGLGFFFVKSISDRDYPMIVGTTLFFAVLFILSQLIVDILYVLVDPRIKLAE